VLTKLSFISLYLFFPFFIFLAKQKKGKNKGALDKVSRADNCKLFKHFSKEEVCKKSLVGDKIRSGAISQTS